jgi:hypothetical protein
MKRLRIFNPDNDMALADGSASYMPPRIIARMTQDLAVLPIWMARPGDAVLAASAYNDMFLREANECFGLGVGLLTPPELTEVGSEYTPMPWGWSPAICRRLSRAGMDNSLLPDNDRLELVRRASHRQTAVEILGKMQITDNICGESKLLRTVEECREMVNCGRRSLLKAPLSGSGKGLNWCPGQMTAGIEGWCRQVIERQGAVVWEPVYDKMQDFAMEFEVDGTNEPLFTGYSLFTTSRSGSYEGNLLMSDEDIESRLAGMVSLSTLQTIRSALPSLLKEQLGEYKGDVGVDMMVCRINDEAKIHPCVEVNLRTNMGILSHHIYKMYVSPGSHGLFRLDFHSRPGEALEAHSRLSAERPATIINGRLISGYLPLTPVTKNTMYRAYLNVYEK